MDKAWYAPRAPDEVIARPWLAPAAVAYFERLLNPEWRVLEHGAGGSTLWLAERVSAVVTIEHDFNWRDRVRQLAPANVAILAMPPESGAYDLFFIDGERAMRGPCLTLAPSLVRPGGWIVLDNANRPEYEQERAALFGRAKLIARFDSNIPRSSYFVTEFWQLCE